MSNEQTEATNRTNPPNKDDNDIMAASTNVTQKTEICTVGTTTIKMCQHVSVIQCALYCLRVACGNCASFHFDTDVYTQKHVSYNTSHHRVLTFEKSTDF